MSVSPIGAQLPIVDAAGFDMRDEKTRAALGFERQLLLQLTQQLSKSAAPAEEDESAATSTYRDMLPDTLADALIRGGGIGLARQLIQEDRS
jgi:Rod binding domain-containing protein